MHDTVLVNGFDVRVSAKGTKSLSGEFTYGDISLRLED